MMPTVFYLYCLDFPNGKKYIGLTKAPAKRLYAHNLAAREGKLPVHYAFRKHGQPRMRLLCAGEKQYIAELEIKAIAAFHTRDIKCGYNVSLGGQTAPTLIPEIAAKAGAARRGKPFTAEHRARIGIKSAGRKHTPESRARQSEVMKGRPSVNIGRKHSPETRARMSAAKKGRPSPLKGRTQILTPEERARRRAAALGNKHCKGKTHSPETRLKISIAKKGTKASPETRAKLSAARLGNKNRKGIPHTAETRARISATQKGRKHPPHSPETIAKIRETHLRRHRLKRELRNEKQLSLF